MVDCGNSRCLQEKRSFKKELLSWSKKIPIAVGLERIAEELAGENVIKELLLPFNDLEKTEKEDWEQQNNCFFCESRLHMMFEALEKLMEEVKSGKNLQDNPSLRYLQELLPYCPQFYTHNIGREILAELKSTSHGFDKDVEMNIPQTQKEPIELKIPHIISHTRQKVKENQQVCKKSYTDDELTAAVNEIQSGKLGTRRASVLYGIPRSTLRNKIFRMGTDKQSIFALNSEEGYEDALAAEIALKWTDLIQGSFRPLFIQQLPLMLNPDFKVMESGDDFEKKLEYIRKKHNLSRRKERYLSDYAHELRLPHLHKIIKKLTEERFEMERNADRVRKMNRKDSPKLQLAKNSNIEVPSLPPTPPTSDIVIPSFKSAQNPKTDKDISEQLSHSFDKYENTRLGDTLKDIIVKTISEKVRVKSQALQDYCNNSLSHKIENDVVIKPEPQSPSPSPFKKIKRDDYERKRDHHDHLKPLKKTRPKRGQYRKYNSQLLMEAVKAVQRGEMSVHRAGSYYGVPHSTLEYKVKERHLLRQKKIKEQKEAAARAAGSGSSVTNHSSNSNSSTGTDSESITPKKEPEEEMPTPTSKLPITTSWMPSFFSATSSLAGAADLNFFGSAGYALSTPASELLRKLQHKVQTKADESDSCSNSGEGYVYIH